MILFNADRRDLFWIIVECSQKGERLSQITLLLERQYLDFGISILFAVIVLIIVIIVLQAIPIWLCWRAIKHLQ